MRDEDRAVLADRRLGAGDDQYLAALDDALEVQRHRVAQESVDLARGDESLDLVAWWVERLGGVATILDQGRELALPVAPGELGASDLAELRDDLPAV